MSEAADSSRSNQTTGNLSDFLLAQKSGYLQALEQGEAQRSSWTISMGNEAGGLLFNRYYTIMPVFLMTRSTFRSRLAGERHCIRVVRNLAPRATDGAASADSAPRHLSPL
jgi:hypothetical protein